MDRPWSILSSVSIRSVSLISLLTLALPTTFASRSSDDLSLVKRQSLGFNTSFGDNGGSFSSDLPIACVEGCLPNLVNFLGCTTLNASDTTAGEPTASDYCSWLCGSSNYTGFTQCLNCVIANGEQDVTLNDVNEKLRQANEKCSKTISSTISQITASPTTTAATFTTFTENTVTFPTWTGLQSFVAAQSTPDPLGTGSTSLPVSSVSESSRASGASTTLSSSMTNQSHNQGATSSAAAASASASGAAISAVTNDHLAWVQSGALAVTICILIV